MQLKRCSLSQRLLTDAVNVAIAIASIAASVLINLMVIFSTDPLARIIIFQHFLIFANFVFVVVFFLGPSK